MPRAIGTIVTVAVGVAALTALTACDKPAPEITVLSGSTTVVVTPQTYCTDLSHCHTPGKAVPKVRAKAGATLLIDVPRSIADHSWAVSSGTFSNNQLRAFVGANYSTGTVHNTHTASVDVPYGVGTYTLAVTTNTDAWIAQVTVTR